MSFPASIEHIWRMIKWTATEFIRWDAGKFINMELLKYGACGTALGEKRNNSMFCWRGEQLLGLVFIQAVFLRQMVTEWGESQAKMERRWLGLQMSVWGKAWFRLPSIQEDTETWFNSLVKARFGAWAQNFLLVTAPVSRQSLKHQMIQLCQIPTNQNYRSGYRQTAWVLILDGTATCRGLRKVTPFFSQLWTIPGEWE